MLKCSEYKSYSILCLSCDIKSDIKCSKEFDFDKPLKYKVAERNDMMNCSWNECPTCKQSIGYHPKVEDFRCPKCNQKILW